MGGLARPMQLERGTMAVYSTRFGEVGTPGYIDPEYVTSGEYHTHSDVYSMGIVILQLLTGRAARWGPPVVNVSDFCYECSESRDMEALADPAAAWPEVAIVALVELGLECTETGRGAARRRPTVPTCIERVEDLLQSLAAPACPAPWEEMECMVCLEELRGRNRFRPCKHSVCCAGCAAILTARGDACPVCRTPIESVQEGIFRNTFEPDIE